VNIKSQRDFFAGLMFGIIGVAFAVGAKSYSIGTGARMGPGYFPMLLGVILAGLGVLILINSLRSKVAGGDKVGAFAWRPVCYILGANLVFGLLLGGLPSIKVPAMGLIAAIYAVVIISSMASEQFKLKSSIILASVLAVGSYLAFIVLLKLQMPVWPTFITG
jgi:Tripartite tricarboxylate transporter TctB family